MNHATSPAKKINPWLVLFFSLVSIALSYYLVILLHEWGHGTTAYFFGVKDSPFDVDYGGWLLLNVDEGVNYPALMEAGKNLQAGLIGATGVTVNILLLLLSFFALTRDAVKNNSFFVAFFYWFAVLNLMGVFGYIPLATFADGGDIYWLTEGLNFSPWWILIPGTLLVTLALVRLFRVEIVKLYVFAPIRSLAMRRVALFGTLFILFWLLYSHGQNPFSVAGSIGFSQILSWISIALVPILLVVCDPSRKWVQEKINFNSGRGGQS